MIKKMRRFGGENVLMSVGGHLVLLALMFVSFSVVIERAKLVTPNRIVITEIDLAQVKITGDETKLYNTTAPEEKPVEKDVKKAEEPKSIPDEKTPLKQPTMVESESKSSTPEKNEKKIEKKVEDKPAPRKKTIVRVNREVLTGDRTMTVSVTDALRVALTRCWNIDTNHSGIEDIRLTAHIRFLPTGVVDRLWFESETRAETDPDFAYVLDTAKAAIKTCSPFSMLPRKEFETWKNTTVTFYPVNGKVM